MPPEETAVKSTLDKPLHLLTDDDISQLTREDCRRYLKQKGMRRPSWNKSQAIQQVISLKKLLETTPDSETGRHSKKLYTPTPENNNTNNNSHRVPECASPNANIGVSGTVPFKEKDPENSSRCGDLPGSVEALDNELDPPRTIGSPDMPVEQMTIFYCGKVNVYDDVPADKARAIMHLAASPPHILQDAPFNGTMAVRSPSCQFQGAGVRGGPEPAAVLLPAPQPVRTSENSRLYGDANSNFHEDNPEGPGSRKASVQRYLEKRKERSKSKRKVGATSSASLDIYLNHQMGNQTLNEQTGKANTCSPSQIRPPTTPTRCSSSENNIARNAKNSAAVND